jgi:nicotinamidase-related amidase
MGTAILVIDMQKFFHPMAGGRIIPNISKLVSHFRSQSLPCIFTQHGHTKAELTPPFKNQLVRKWGPEGSIAMNSEDWELIPEISDLVDGSPVVAKNTYDAFINTDLARILEDQKIERVVVVGVMTDCCCDTTARSAFNRGYEPWVVSDACGSANKRQHEAGLRGFGYGFGEVVTTKEVMDTI